MPAIDPAALTQALVRCASVTPWATAALDIVQEHVEGLGFACHRIRVGEVDNLYARLGTGQPHLGFAGHVDVVPPGDIAGWTVDPFGAEIRAGALWGRGAVDMKSGVACFVAAVDAHRRRTAGFDGSISLLITGDEESVAIDGTRRILEWMEARGAQLDGCLVGEPTSVAVVGDMAKIGRRGSANGHLEVRGRQGHTAYPAQADNAAHRLVRMLEAMLASALDAGTPAFEPSHLQITSIDVANSAGNVIPGRASARFNIRYNDLHDAASLRRWLGQRCDEIGGDYTLDLVSSGDAFVTAPG